MSLKGSNNAEKIWNFLKSKGFNDYGIAGMMGNLYAESGLNPTNLQNSYEKSLGYTDDEYTKAVDKGKYGDFIKDSAGFGIAQWTYWSRKKALLEYAKSSKKSIGDLEMQLEFLYKELSEGYKSVLETLKNAKSVLEASNAVLLKFERPADQSKSVQEKRASYGMDYYNKYFETKTNTNGGIKMGYSNSKLVNCTVKSPNHSGTRTHKIDRITPHCVVGQLSAEGIGGCFTSTSVQASCNYGIGYDARVCLIVDEKNRSWCSSSNSNDQRAVTIECASDSTAPYAFKSVVYDKLVKLCVDICKRNGLKKVLWFGDKTKSLNYNPKDGECVLTVHRWFANKSCPGDWMYSRMGQLAKDINKALGVTTTNTTTNKNETSTKPTTTKTTYKVGDIVKFTGTKHYVSATANNGTYCKAGTAKVTSVYPSGKHIYHLVAEKNGGSTVYGWVDAASIAGLKNTSTTKPSFKAYKVKVTADVLNIRKGAGTNYAICGSIKDNGVYTIVEEKTGTGAKKWGLLKSKAGWISLDYVKKI